MPDDNALVLEELARTGIVAPDDGAGILDDVRAALTKYVVFPSAEAADALALFTAATHAQPAWEHATRLIVKSPIKRCGKTRLQEIVGELSHRPLKTTNISTAALVRSIDEHDPPTLILDEADAIFAKRRGERSEGAEDLRGILNSGHSRSWPYVRWDVAARRSEECPTFAMAVIGGIGTFPDTLEDRAVVVKMSRRAPGEKVAQFRRRRAVPHLHELRNRLHAWVAANIPVLSEAEPDVPAEDRAADTWEPLAAVAQVAGGNWPERAWVACKAFLADTDPDDATAGERLLADMRDVLSSADKLSTGAILKRLHDIEEAPWGDWYGRPLNARDLARLLRPYGIQSKSVRIGNDTPKGYERGAFLDAWERYLGTSPPQAQQTPQPPKDPSQTRCGDVADDSPLSATSSEQGKQSDVADVADVTAGRLEDATCSRCGTPTFQTQAPGPVLCLGCEAKATLAQARRHS